MPPIVYAPEQQMETHLKPDIRDCAESDSEQKPATARSKRLLIDRELILDLKQTETAAR